MNWYIELRGWSDDEFDQWLDERYPLTDRYVQLRFFDDSDFNAPSQPVVGL